MSDKITLSREQMNDAAMLYDTLQAARENRSVLQNLGGLSYVGEAFRGPKSRHGRCFMGPQAAVLMGESGRSHLGGMAYRDWQQFAQQPATSDVHVDAIITDISIRYRNADYIGPLVFPRVQVVHRSNKYFTFDLANLRNDAALRAPGGKAIRTGYTPSTGSYSVETYSVEHAVPDEVRNNADNPLNPDRNGSEFIADVLDLKLEKQVAALANTSANWTTNATLSGTSQWSDYANSDPLGDVKTARTTIVGQIAKKPNTMTLGYQVFEGLALHPDLLDRCKYTGTNQSPAMVTAQMMAALFMVDQVLVGMAIENTAAEGQTDSLSYVWGKHAWVGFVAPTASIDTPSAGYVFTTGRVGDRYREPQTKSDILRLEEAWDTKKTAAGAGYRLINAVA